MLLVRERLGLTGKIFLPVFVGADILFVLVDVAVDDVVTVGTLQRRQERERKYLFVLTQEPGVSLAAGKPGAVDS